MSSERIQEAIAPLYAAAELALTTKRYADACARIRAPEDVLEAVAEIAFQAVEALRRAALELDQAVFQSRGSHRPPGSPGLN